MSLTDKYMTTHIPKYALQYKNSGGVKLYLLI